MVEPVGLDLSRARVQHHPQVAGGPGLADDLLGQRKADSLALQVWEDEHSFHLAGRLVDLPQGDTAGGLSVERGEQKSALGGLVLSGEGGELVFERAAVEVGVDEVDVLFVANHVPSDEGPHQLADVVELLFRFRLDDLQHEWVLPERAAGLESLPVQAGLLERILREAGSEGVLEALAERLSPTDLQSLLLKVAKRRAEKVTPARLMQRYRDDRFVQPAAADVRDMVDFDRLAFSLASGFQPVELSPVCPLGTVSALGLVDQNNVVSTVRGTEVVADSTNVMALECAKRRGEEGLVRLCASHRLVRAQSFSGPASFAHFRVFTMCSAGRDSGAMRFETEALVEHIGFYLRLLSHLQATGMEIRSVRVALTDFLGEYDEVLESVRGRLREEHDGVVIEKHPERTQARNYYEGLAFWVFVSDASGEEFNVCDGGFTDWTRKLLSNKKERLFISAIGSERLCYLFGARRARGSG